MQVMTESGWLPEQAVVIEGSTIKTIIPAEMRQNHMPAREWQYPAHYYLVPGFIDMHIHGANGSDVMDGTEEALINIARSLIKEGVTSFLATTMTATALQLEKILRVIASQRGGVAGGAKLLGAHLEGPFISAEKRGAQGDALALPNVDIFDKWQLVTDNIIKVLTLAPELPGALAFMRSLRLSGETEVVLSMGHSNATYAQAERAIAAGCRQATHLFNAMRGIHQREPGIVTACLLSPVLYTEIIVDGVHLHPALVKLIYQLKRKETILLVTDAIRAKCLKAGYYDLAGQRVKVEGKQATLDDGTLAGSVLSMPQAIKNMVEYTQCSLHEAISMATINPAKQLRLANKGRVAVGCDADLVVLNQALEVVLTMREGQVLYHEGL
jgi:N-acetylglucosamine-6-phosphate deacetylase